MFKGTSWKSGDFDEIGDLAKFRQRFNENSNCIFQRAAWKVAVLTKTANVAKMSIWQKIAKNFHECSNYMSNGTPWKMAIFTKMENMAKTAIWPKIAEGLTKILEKWRFWREWRIRLKWWFSKKSPKVLKKNFMRCPKESLEKIKTSYQSLGTVENGRFASI